MTIAASDDAHGVFQFSPKSLSVHGTEPEDGHSSVVLQVGVTRFEYWDVPSTLHRGAFNNNAAPISQVDRSFGDLSGVTVYWEADPGSERELLSSSGNVSFGVGQTSGNITINVAQDETPELDETFTVSLVNVSHGRLGAQTSAALTVLASDDPYGIFVFTNVSRSVRLPEADATVHLAVSRQKGLMGQVCAGTKIETTDDDFVLNSGK